MRREDAPDMSTSDSQRLIAEPKAIRSLSKAEKARSGKGKVSTTIRLSPEVVEYFRASGPGWHSCIDHAPQKLIGME